MDFCGRAVVPDVSGDFNFDLDTMDTFQDVNIKSEYFPAPDILAGFSVDHSINLFEFDSLKDFTLDLDAVVRTGEKRSILDDLDTKDKIRRDCMWSTGQNLAKFFKPDTKSFKVRQYTSVLNEEQSLTPPTSYINEYLKHFETPLSSDEDSSCSSGDEVDVAGHWSALTLGVENRVPDVSSLLNTSSKDHCYTTKKNTSSLLTPPESSEDEDSYQGFFVSNQTTTELRGRSPLPHAPFNQALKSFHISSPRPKLRHLSKPKFTFKINIRTKSKQFNKNKFLNSLPSRLPSRRRPSGGSHPVSSPSENSEKPKDARDLHNHMERQRRTELKNAFDLVKNCVPTISCSDRVSKQMILDKAIEFCRAMRLKEATVNKHRRAHMERNNILQKKLRALQTETRLAN